jgi:lysophospholipid acyltransferase (LPLAT)-like uncharacterized protein
VAKLSSKHVSAGPVQKVLGILVADYMRLIWKTNRIVFEPADVYARFDSESPAIIAVWHGQHLLVPCLQRKSDRSKTLISRHRDGEFNAIAVERFGIGTIRGSGDHGRDFHRKGAVSGFKSMLQALAEGYHMVLTADVPKVSRVAGLGIVKLAQLSGRPILPLAIATSRRVELDNWDRSALHLPFGHGAVVLGDPIRVASQADDAELERLRSEVQTALNAVTARAYALTNRPKSGAQRV